MSEPTKIAVVTGGSRGIGRATALALAAHDIDVVFTYRANAEAAAATVAEINRLGRTAVAVQHDIGDLDALGTGIGAIRSALRDTWQRDSFDYLVNNAGNGITKPLSLLTEDDFDAMMNVHVKGAVFLTMKLLPLMVDGGGIINISSGLTRVTAPAAGGYAMMKGAIEVFARHLAAEVGPRGISVNIVAPGPTATDFGGGLMKEPNVSAGIAQLTVFGEIGSPDAVGATVVAVLTGTSRVTAQRIEVGGFAV